ncbi:MAG: hypothetical protein KF732_05250 [Flavobacteriales bacterium]|nr:hypothetical protein [Flavobacteriales bacterium]
MSPFEQKQEQLEKNIGKTTEIELNSGKIIKGNITRLISCKLRDTTISDYYSVIIINNHKNISWNEIRTIKF